MPCIAQLDLKNAKEQFYQSRALKAAAKLNRRIAAAAVAQWTAHDVYVWCVGA